MNLLDLPVNTRGRILRLLLTRPCPIDILSENKRTSRFDIQDQCFASEDTSIDGCGYLECLQGLRDADQFIPSTDNRWICVGPLFSIAVLRVCKQIYLEAFEILYTANKFILNSVAPKNFPVSKIRSLQINALYLTPGKDLVNKYQQLIESLSTNCSLRLTVTSRINNQTFSHDLATSLLSLAPVKSCSLSLDSYKEAQALENKLIGQQADRLFSKYNYLPREIRFQILGYTDLAPGLPGLQWADRIDAGSRFSDRCRCKSDPRDLLKVSTGFRIDALEVMFGKASQFQLGGRIKNHLGFFRDIETHLPRVRTMVLRMSDTDMAKRHTEDLYWDGFIDHLIAHCTLPLMSLTVIAPLFWNDDSDNSESDSESNESSPGNALSLHQAYYCSFIPGFQRLIENGLVELDFQFLQQLNSWTEEYRRRVFGERLQVEQDL